MEEAQVPDMGVMTAVEAELSFLRKRVAALELQADTIGELVLMAHESQQIAKEIRKEITLLRIESAGMFDGDEEHVHG